MIEIKQLTKIFKSKKGEKVIALDNLSFNLPDKGFVFIIGKSGSGKSTLLNLIGGLDNITDGQIIFNNEDITKFKSSQIANYRNSAIGIIFQDYHLIDSLTIFENIKLALDICDDINYSKIDDILKIVDLEGYGNKYPKELSGGEQQRVAIARALIKDPKIILADEPTGNLDAVTTIKVLDLLKEISKTKLVIIVSHNYSDALKYGDRIIELSNGQLKKDLLKNKNFINKLNIKNETLMINKNLEFHDEDYNFLKDNINNFNSIDWDNSEFIENNEEIIQEVVSNEAPKGKFKFKNKIKLGLKFLKTKWVSMAVYSLIISSLMVVLGFCQLVAKFDKGTVIETELSKIDSDVIALNKDTYDDEFEVSSDFYKEISEGDKEKFYSLDLKNEQGILTNYTIKLNNNYLYFQGQKKFKIDPFEPQFINCSRGTLVTTEQFVNDKYGVDNKVKYLLKNPEYKEYGVYITDICADSLLHFNKKINTYDDILKKYSVNTGSYDFYLNGIIFTNYKERYKELFKKIENLNYDKEKLKALKKEPEYVKFISEITETLALCYSYEPEFLNKICSYEPKSWVHIGSAVIEGNYYEDLEFSYIGQLDLKDNQIVITDELANSLGIKTYPTTLNIDVYKYYDVNKARKVDTLTYEVIGRNAKNYIDCSKNIFPTLNKLAYYECGFYFTDLDKTSEIINFANNLGYQIISPVALSLNTMTGAVEAFSSVFNLLFVTLTIGTFILTLIYCLKVVKDRIYEIGVLKSLGLKNRDFIDIFLLQILLTVVLVLLFYNVFSVLFVGVANNLLIDSILLLAPNEFILSIRFLYNNPLFMLFNSLLITLMVIISVVFGIIKLNNIKPIDIIKAKE